MLLALGETLQYTTTFCSPSVSVKAVVEHHLVGVEFEKETEGKVIKSSRQDSITVLSALFLMFPVFTGMAMMSNMTCQEKSERQTRLLAIRKRVSWLFLTGFPMFKKTDIRILILV